MFLRLHGWIRALTRPDAVEREMHEEMQRHLDQATDRLVARGMSVMAARAEARREFGNVPYIQEEARDARGVRWAEHARQDLRYGLRGLSRSPGFTTTVVLTFALGVGANAAIFSLIDPLLVRNPGGVPAANRVHRVYIAGSKDVVPYLSGAS